MSKPFIPVVGDIIRNKKRHWHWHGQRPSTWKILSYDLQTDSYQLEAIHSSFSYVGMLVTCHAHWIRYEMELGSPGKRMVTW